MTNSGYEMVVSAEALLTALRRARAVALGDEEAQLVIRPQDGSAILEVIGGPGVTVCRIDIPGAVGSPAPYPIALARWDLVSRLAALRGTCSLRVTGEFLTIEEKGPEAATRISIIAEITAPLVEWMMKIPCSPTDDNPPVVLGADDVKRLASLYARCYRHLRPPQTRVILAPRLIIIDNWEAQHWGVLARAAYHGEQWLIVPTGTLRALALQGGSSDWKPMWLWRNARTERLSWCRVDGILELGGADSAPKDISHVTPASYITAQKVTATARRVPTEPLLRALQAARSPKVCLHLNDGLVAITSKSISATVQAKGGGVATCETRASLLKIALQGETEVDIRLLRGRWDVVHIRGREDEGLHWVIRAS